MEILQYPKIPYFQSGKLLCFLLSLQYGNVTVPQNSTIPPVILTALISNYFKLSIDVWFLFGFFLTFAILKWYRKFHAIIWDGLSCILILFGFWFSVNKDR